MQAKLSVSSRGLVALPSAMLEAAGIRTHDSVIAETIPEGILLRPAVKLREETYTSERIAEFDAAESEMAQAFEQGGSPETPAWIPLADEALKRAALRARDVAIQTNTGILVMIDGRMVTITAAELRAEREKGRVSSQTSGSDSSELVSTQTQAGGETRGGALSLTEIC